MIEVTITVTVDGVTKLKTVGIVDSMDNLPNVLRALLNMNIENEPAPVERRVHNEREAAAFELMARLGGANYPIERAKVRTWLANMKAGRLQQATFDQKIATMKAWLSLRITKARRRGKPK
jgi:hypothetical protein